jgi:hypothetical protein
MGICGSVQEFTVVHLQQDIRGVRLLSITLVFVQSTRKTKMNSMDRLLYVTISGLYWSFNPADLVIQMEEEGYAGNS